MNRERKIEAVKGAYRAMFKDFYDEFKTKKLWPGRTAYAIAAASMDNIVADAKKECWKEFF